MREREREGGEKEGGGVTLLRPKGRYNGGTAKIANTKTESNTQKTEYGRARNH